MAAAACYTVLHQAGTNGWYVVWNVTDKGYHAPKRLWLLLNHIPIQREVLWSTCYPAGTSFKITKIVNGAKCLNVDLTQVDSRYELLRGGGHSYWVDGNNCLHLKLTDVATEAAGVYQGSQFIRNGLYLDASFISFRVFYDVVATGPAMSGEECSDHWCPLPVRAGLGAL
eukprot:gene4485-4739_t